MREIWIWENDIGDRLSADSVEELIEIVNGYKEKLRIYWGMECGN